MSKLSNSMELTKEMKERLEYIDQCAGDYERSFYTTEDWLEEFGSEFPGVPGYYVDSENIIEVI